MRNQKYTHVSLFAGAGGLDIGLEQAGFKTIWANDFDHDACETHRLWCDAPMIEGDIGKVDFDTIPDADVITGGFPCLTGDTNIVTKNGIKQLIDIKPGDLVLSHDMQYHPVLNFFDQGIKPTYRIKTAIHETIVATGNHRFYVRKQIGDMFSEPAWVMIDTIYISKDTYYMCMPSDMCTESDNVLFLDGEPLAWYKIESIAPKGMDHVYDIEVEDAHSFVANRAITHNCQGFSLAGPRKIDDSRNVLYKHFVRLVEKKQPLVFIAENVKGFLTLGNGAIAEAVLADFESKGYNVTLKLLNAADYGVPQDRMRVIIVGIRKDLGIDFTFPEPATPNHITLKDAIGNMPAPLPDEVCTAPYSSRYMSRSRRRDWNECSFTIPAMAKQVALHPSSPKMNKLGTDLWEFGKGNTRRLSYKECAAIQTFPKDMVFCGDLTSKYKQIGNAVPCELGKYIGLQVYDLLEQYNKR